MNYFKNKKIISENLNQFWWGGNSILHFFTAECAENTEKS